MKCLFIALLAASITAQTLSPTLSAPLVSPGGTTTLSIVFTDSATGTSTVGAEWGLVLPPGVQAGVWMVTGTGRTLSCNGFLCLEYQPAAPIVPFSSGTIATVVLTISPQAAPGSFPISLTGVLAPNVDGTFTNALAAVDANGSDVAITSAPVNLIITSKYDLNGDGIVNSVDVQIALQQALRLTPCTNGDVNGDRKCNIKDLRLMIEASQGKIF